MLLVTPSSLALILLGPPCSLIRLGRKRTWKLPSSWLRKVLWWIPGDEGQVRAGGDGEGKGMEDWGGEGGGVEGRESWETLVLEEGRGGRGRNSSGGDGGRGRGLEKWSEVCDRGGGGLRWIWRR